MTKVKMCGLTRAEDIAAVNVLQPEYIGFVFVSKSKRYITKQQAASLRTRVDKTIKVVGVFVDEDVKVVAEYLNCGIIDLAQLHGSETEDYINKLRSMTEKPVIKAFRITSKNLTLFRHPIILQHIKLGHKLTLHVCSSLRIFDLSDIDRP